MDETTAPALPANTLEITLAVTVVFTLAVATAIIVGSMARRLLGKVLGEVQWTRSPPVSCAARCGWSGS
jgi:hypothetical protein